MKAIENIDMIGIKFNMLTISSLKFRENGRTYVMATCDCGKENRVAFDKIKNGHTKSCGCVSIGLRKHFKTTHPLYRIWDAMRYRCNNTNASNYKNYGGRGISVCSEWVNDFETFYNWAIDNNWESGLQINRIDNNSGYRPDNCNIVTAKENARNRRSNRILIINGQEVIMQEAHDLRIIDRSKFYKNKQYRESFVTVGDITT